MCPYMDICSPYIYLLSIYSIPVSPTVDSVLAPSSSVDVREKRVVRYFPFPLHGFLRAVSDAEIKGYEGRLSAPPPQPFIFSSYAVYIQFFFIHLLIQVLSLCLPVGFTAIWWHATANCIHLVTPLCLSLFCHSPCSIAYPYLLGFLQSNQFSLHLSLSLSAPPHSLSPPSCFPTPAALLSLPSRYFSQRRISTPRTHTHTRTRAGRQSEGAREIVIPGIC